MSNDEDISLFGRMKDKLIEVKQAWARDSRLITGQTAAHEQRLPPGQRLVKDWPVLDLGVHPNIPAQRSEERL